MTVYYSLTLADSHRMIGRFFRTLFRWRGSIYKMIWKDVIVFLVLYSLIRLLYRMGLNESQKRTFENISQQALSYTVVIPESFILGFYVQLVFKRRDIIFWSISWPDRVAFLVSAHIKGLNSRSRMIRRTIVRYLSLAYILTMCRIAPPIKKRFPTLDHMMKAGLMLPHERKNYDRIKVEYGKHGIPCVWAVKLVILARKEGRIYDDFAPYQMIEEINFFQYQLETIFRMDRYIVIPLVYTQVVTLAVYVYLVLCLLGTQFLDHRRTASRDDTSDKDVYINFGFILQLFLYMGWLKVAELMINPFGGDDDDFDINLLIDRNNAFSYLMVDDMHSDFPELVRDNYWEQETVELPYTLAASRDMEKAESDAIVNELGTTAGVITDAAKITDAKSPTEPETPIKSNFFARILFRKKHTQFSVPFQDLQPSEDELARRRCESTDNLGVHLATEAVVNLKKIIADSAKNSRFSGPGEKKPPSTVLVKPAEKKPGTPDKK